MLLANDFRKITAMSKQGYNTALDYLYDIICQEASSGYLLCNISRKEVEDRLPKDCTIEGLIDILIGRGFRVIMLDDIEVSW